MRTDLRTKSLSENCPTLQYIPVWGQVSDLFNNHWFQVFGKNQNKWTTGLSYFKIYMKWELKNGRFEAFEQIRMKELLVSAIEKSSKNRLVSWMNQQRTGSFLGGYLTLFLFFWTELSTLRTSLIGLWCSFSNRCPTGVCTCTTMQYGMVKPPVAPAHCVG